ncbi:unnamed protein product [Rangifer tarandus platyrhynchus]|uniref:Uncharacterized protein n=1 Tax=Rangifer tarandus platyrhynchus TaxID=3082113 RepID=A0AC60A3V4_RANTA
MWQPPRDTRGVWSGTRVCSWVPRAAQGVVDKRDVDTIGPSWAQPLPCLSSAPAPGEQR